MIFNKKLAASMLFAVSISLAFGVGCGGDDEDSGDGDGDTPGDGDGLGTCETLCAAAEVAECGTAAECEGECVAASAGCPDEMEAYLACTADASEADVSCVPVTKMGIVLTCGDELGALQVCASASLPGDGGAGGGTN